MTKEEVKTIINEAKNQDWVKSISLRFFNTKSEFNLTITDLSAIYEYAYQQAEGWNGITRTLPSHFVTIKEKINHLKVQLELFVQTFLTKEGANITTQWNNTITKSFNGNYIPYERSEVDFLINLNINYPNYYSGAYDFLFGSGDFSNMVTNRNSFIGMLMAYEFTTKESSLILQRKDSEAFQLLNIKKDFQTYLTTSEIEFQNLLREIKNEKVSDSESISNLLNANRKEFDTWHTSVKFEFDNFKSEASKKLADLESSYSDKLKLEEPSKYWKDRATELKDKGDNMLKILVGLIVIGGFCLYFLLWKTPEGLLASFFDNDKSVALRWSIVFVMFISLIFLGIRYVSKMMFSSYHLARDAEERHRLTYLYLALRKDGLVDKEERQLIFQALFSRADTGLLKEDSSPTMPSGIDKIIAQR